ncbi:hypothetical protein ACA910_004175 [Epithemia clementina (nom. ined.)]
MSFMSRDLSSGNGRCMASSSTNGSSFPSMRTTKFPSPGSVALISTRALSPTTSAILVARVLNSAPHCLQASMETSFLIIPLPSSVSGTFVLSGLTTALNGNLVVTEGLFLVGAFALLTVTFLTGVSLSLSVVCSGLGVAKRLEPRVSRPITESFKFFTTLIVVNTNT